MPVERFYYPSDLLQGNYIELVDQEFHHLVNVMRAEEGDIVEIVNGKGTLAQAILERLEKRKACFRVKQSTFTSQPPFKRILAQAIPRMNRLDFILEKGTELGMDEIWLFPSQLGERKQLTEHQIERLSAITISAMKQCGRLFLPKLVTMPALESWEKLPCSAFFGDLSDEAPLLKDRLPDRDKKEDFLFFIGPESGFSEKEEGALRHLGAKGVKLHTNVLRTDTAALMALSLLSHWMMD